jgi:lysophospholipase L1-like esterase
MSRKFIAGVGFIMGVAVLGALVLGGGRGEGSSSDVAPPPAYLSLGDSLAYGQGVDDPATEGFAALLHKALQPGAPDGSATPGDFVNLGALGGVTSTSMLDEQLGDAIDEIQGRRETASPVDDFKVITLSIGGNDFFDLVDVCQTASLPLDATSDCVQTLVHTYTDFQANLTLILSRLRAAAGPETQIAVLTYYNSLPSCQLVELAPLAELALEGDGGQLPGLDNLIRAVAASQGAIVVEGYGLIGDGDLVGGTDCLHPNQAGHQKLAEAFEAALSN